MACCRNAVWGLCLAALLLPSADARAWPSDHTPPARRPQVASSTPPLLEIRKDRSGSTRVYTVTSAPEAPGAEAPEAFWVAFYNSVSDSLFAAGKPARQGRGNRRRATPTADGLVRLGMLCKKQAQELEQWPVDSVAERVQPNADQQRHLHALREAAGRAATTLSAACDAPVSGGTLQRLAIVHHRVDGMLRAAETLRPILREFVENLDGIQRARFAQMSDRRRERSIVDQQEATAFCRALVGTDRVDAFARPLLRASRPRREQRQIVNDVMIAALRGHQLLYESCALDRSGDPLNQLEVMRQRLQMSADAADGMRSALEDYYAALDDRQKRGFARLGYGSADTRASLRQ